MENLELGVGAQSAGVDWLTVTVKDLSRQGLLCDEANRLMDALKAKGNTQKIWKFKGYNGYICGSVRWGTRDDGSILMLSGEGASLNWPVALAWCDNCSRIDLAVTVTMIAARPHIARDAYEVLVPPCSDVKSPRKLSFITNSDGGETMYIGSRMSDQYGRLYDKGIEACENTDVKPGLIWRYEVEFKQYRAQRIAKELLKYAKTSENYTENLGETVYKWFLSRGVQPIFSPYNAQPFHTEVYARLSDDDVTLRWLSTQVSPSVARLNKNGRGEEVLEALGLNAD